jgi:ribonuclease HII
MPDFSWELRFEGALVCGIDEAGRGPLAGPVVAAAGVFRAGPPPSRLLDRLDDSKLLSAATRVALVPEIYAHADVGIGAATVEEIDGINILQATFLAMRRAHAALAAALGEAWGAAPVVALVDGNRAPGLDCPTETISGGDGLCASIAAASIVAKVTRDAGMTALAEAHPGYGWERNAGYGTPEHLQALGRLGVTAQHRRSFRPISELLTLRA